MPIRTAPFFRRWTQKLTWCLLISAVLPGYGGAAESSPAVARPSPDASGADRGFVLYQTAEVGPESFRVCGHFESTGERPVLLQNDLGMDRWLLHHEFTAGDTPVYPTLLPSEIGFHPSNPAFPPYPSDPMGYNLLRRGITVTSCRTFETRRYSQRRFTSRLVFRPSIDADAELPYSPERLQYLAAIPRRGDDTSSNVCQIDLDRRRADCPR